jgi:hypothetical protein
MQYLPPPQADVPISGTFMVRQNALPLGSVTTLAAGLWADVGHTGSTAFFDPWDVHAPIGGDPTGVFAETAYTSAGSWMNIVNAKVSFTALENRNYLALFSIQWRYQTANWAHCLWRITDNGSETGIFPAYWQRSYNNAPNNSDTFVHTLPFFLPNWKPGLHTLQLQRHSNGTGGSQIMFTICAAVVL